MVEEETAQGMLLTVRLTGEPGKPWGFTAKEIFRDDDMTDVLLIISKVCFVVEKKKV